MWAAAESKYQPLDAEDSPLEAVAGKKTRTRYQLNSTCTIAVVALALVAFILAVASYVSIGHSHTLSKAPQRHSYPCGRTPAQAKARGCTFDVMMDEWLPESCMDRELLEEFKSLQAWSFWADENRTQPIDETQLSESAVAYTTLEYHVAHCAFAVRKFHRAIASNRPIEQAVADVAHTTHCAEMHREVIGKLELARNQEGEQYSIIQSTTPLHPGFPICVDSKEVDMHP